MAIELLLYAPPHRAIHDAESLIYVLLFLCTHLSGPGEVHDPPVFGPGRSDHRSGIRHWLNVSDLNVLGHTKFSQMNFHTTDIFGHLSPYFTSLIPHFSTLWGALFPLEPRKGTAREHSSVTLHDLINAFKTVLKDQSLIDKARAAMPDNLRKRSHPGELVISGNGWDAIPAPKKQMVATTTTTKRSKSFMRKGHRQ